MRLCGPFDSSSAVGGLVDVVHHTHTHTTTEPHAHTDTDDCDRHHTHTQHTHTHTVGMNLDEKVFAVRLTMTTTILNEPLFMRARWRRSTL